MTSEELKRRTKEMSLSVIRLVTSLPRSREVDIFSRQVIRSATSVAANYRAACKARSRADFINKIGIVEEEADETALWIEYLLELNIVAKDKGETPLKEVYELVAIFAASAKTAKQNRK
ncbi:MAG: four helix bundle protein [Ignavibacteriales bacterium]|nr:four helix bundle protein [Ignavibacteriales bacterium]